MAPPKNAGNPVESQANPQDNLGPNRLFIPALNLSLPVVLESTANETAFQKALQNGVVHYPGTAEAGEQGNVYIFGHSSDYIWSKGDYKSAFALLPKIEIGDKILLTNGQGNLFVYIVTETFVASPKDTYLLKQDPSKHELTLQTSYPLGTALKRFIVKAQLEK